MSRGLLIQSHCKLTFHILWPQCEGSLSFSFISWSISCWRGNTNHIPHQRRRHLEKRTKTSFNLFSPGNRLADRDIKCMPLILAPLVLTCELRKLAEVFYFSFNVWIVTNNLILGTRHPLVNVATPKIYFFGMNLSCVLEPEWSCLRSLWTWIDNHQTFTLLTSVVG